MHTGKTLIAAMAILSAPVAEAAKDPGLMLHEGPGTTRQIGAGVQLTATLPLGRSTVRRAAVPTVNLRAGPSITRSGPTVPLRARTTIAAFTDVAVRPGYSTTWSLAGQPLAASYSPLALREQLDGVPEGERHNISTVGIVAIGVGVAVIIGGLLFIDAVNDASD